MLVLSRQRDETIVFIVGGREIEITIVDIRGEKVRVGTTAPPDIPVWRKEVLDAMKREKGYKPGEVASLAQRKNARRPVTKPITPCSPPLPTGLPAPAMNPVVSVPADSQPVAAA